MNDLISTLCARLHWWSWSLKLISGEAWLARGVLPLTLIEWPTTCGKEYSISVLSYMAKNILYLCYLRHSCIHTRTLWMIDDNPRSWIQLVVGYVIIHKKHYVFLLQPIFLQELIRMTYIRLYMNSKITPQ